MSSSEWELVASETRGSVTALAAAPDDEVFAATPVGVFRSADAGRTWELAADERGVPFGEAIASADTHVFVGAPDGLHRSGDGGRTWQPVLAGSRVAAVCAGAGIVLVGTDSDGVLRSEDDGAHWSGVNAGLLDLEVLAVCLSPGFDTDRLAFVGTASGLYRSRNGGDSWRECDLGMGEPAVQCIAVGPERLVVAGTEADGLVCSEDGGTTWQRPADLADRSVSAVAISSSGEIAAATDSGLLVSTDRGQSWALRPGGPEAILALVYLEEGVLLAGAEGSGAWRLEEAAWSESSRGLHASLLSTLVVGPDNTLWVAGPAEGVRVRCQDTWQERNDGLPDTTVLGLSLTVDGHAFAATPQGLYAWRAGTWRLVLPEPVRAVGGTQRIVALSDRLIASDDLGATWRPLATPFDLRTVAALAGGEADLAIATREASETAVWRSSDDGRHWDRVPVDATLTALALSPDVSLWLATTTGVQVWNDQAQTFVPLGGPRRVIAIAPPYALELGGRLWRRRGSG